jgi:hypothetical protein
MTTMNSSPDPGQSEHPKHAAPHLQRRHAEVAHAGARLHAARGGTDQQSLGTGVAVSTSQRTIVAEHGVDVEVEIVSAGDREAVGHLRAVDQDEGAVGAGRAAQLRAHPTQSGLERLR